MYFRAFFRCGEIRSQNVWKVIICWSIKWRLLLLKQESSHLQIVPQRGMLFLAGITKKALGSAAILAVLDALYAIGIQKARWRKQQKFERRIRKRNHAFGNENIRVRPPFTISSCTVYISRLALFRMSARCVRNLGKTIGRVSTKRQKEHCNSFSLSKGGKAQLFLNLPQMRTNK